MSQQAEAQRADQQKQKIENLGGSYMASHMPRAFAVSVLAAVTFAPSSAAVAQDWKCYTYQSAPASPVNIGLQRMAENIRAVTNGRINVKCSVGGALPIDANSIAPALSDGVLGLREHREHFRLRAACRDGCPARAVRQQCRVRRQGMAGAEAGHRPRVREARHEDLSVSITIRRRSCSAPRARRR